MSQRAVLYVEDDNNDELFLRHAWEKAGLENPLQVVTDGEAALAYLSGEGKYSDRNAHPFPCLVLLDLKLPRLDGFEVLKWIRHQPAFRTLPVLVLSSSNQAIDIHTAHVLGANAYLVKPPRPQGLVEMAASLNAFWLSQAQLPPDCLQFQDDPLAEHAS